MLKKLELNSLRADLAAVENILGRSTREEDPVGWFQFSQRKAALRKLLDEVVAAPVSTAGIGLFFAGRPVIGSRGIVADFGAKAVERFQDIVSTRFAALNGPVGSRGPVRQRERTNLMITEVARGSFGFVLEEFDNETLVDTPLKVVVEEVADIIYKISTPEEQPFEEAMEIVDDRLLGGLRSFFKLLDDAGATLRLVEDEREFSLPREAIERAKERVEAISLEERIESFNGTLYVLPDGKRFELLRSGLGTIKGKLTKEAVAHLIGENGEVRPGILGTNHTISARVREVRLLNGDPHFHYALLTVEGVDHSGDV